MNGSPAPLVPEAASWPERFDRTTREREAHVAASAGPGSALPLRCFASPGQPCVTSEWRLYCFGEGWQRVEADNIRRLPISTPTQR